MTKEQIEARINQVEAYLEELNLEDNYDDMTSDYLWDELEELKEALAK